METYKTTQEQKLENARKHVKRIKGFYTHALVFVLVNVFIIFSNAIADGKVLMILIIITRLFSGVSAYWLMVYRFLVVSCF